MITLSIKMLKGLPAIQNNNKFYYDHRKNPKISPSMYKPPKLVTQKTLR